MSLEVIFALSLVIVFCWAGYDKLRAVGRRRMFTKKAMLEFFIARGGRDDV